MKYLTTKPRRRAILRVPAAAASGVAILASAGYCWNQAHAGEHDLRTAVTTIQRSAEHDEQRGAIMVALRESRAAILALHQAAARSDKGAEHARAAIRQLHELTRETNR